MTKKLLSLLILILFFSSLLIANDNGRDKIEEKYKWDLTDLYPTLDDWNEALENIEGRMGEITQHKGKLGESSANLLQTFDSLYDIYKEYTRLSTYAARLRDEDMNISENAALAQQAGNLGTKLSETASYIDPELLELGESKLNDLIKKEPGLAKYQMAIDDVVRNKKHTLNESEEQILATFGLIAGNSSSVFSIFNNAEKPAPVVELSSGEKAELTSAGYTRYRTVPNREDRAKVFKAFFESYGDFEMTIGENLTGQVKGHFVYSKVKNFESTLEASLNRNNIPTNVYENLITEINNSLPTLHRYLKLKKRMLGYDEMHYYDLYTSMVDKVDMKFTVDEGQEMILNGLVPLGKDYNDVLKEAFENRWIDYYPNKGKRSGAYSSGSAYDVHPYILMNWTDDFNSLSTLAHELGHTMHSYLSNTNQKYPTAGYSIFVAEIASTLNENLLMDYMLKNIDSDDEKLYLLGSYLDNLRGTLFRQVSFAEFEWEIHKKIEAGEPLNGKIMSEIYWNIVTKYYGHEQGICVVDDYIRYEWAYIPHFYYNYYVYQYSTSIIYATAFAEKILNAQPQMLNTGEVGNKVNPAVEQYFKILTGGSSQYPIDLIKDAGLDPQSPEPFELTMQKMNRTMDLMEEILAN
jgi:oligoendopeptidase F